MHLRSEKIEMNGEKKQKFDGYAALYDEWFMNYDEWFMKNENLFTSELRLFEKALGDISGKRLLSVGCGSGLFESYIDCSNVEGIEPSTDMGAIAVKRGVNVIHFGLIEEVELPCEAYDIIYFNGSSSYMEDLRLVYEKSLRALKKGGRLILLDDHEALHGVMPEMPYPLGLASSGVWHSSDEKISILKELGVTNFNFYQTLIKNPMYTNEEPEEVSDGYKSGGYVAIIAEK